MGRVYTIDLPDTAVTTAVDILEIAPADDKPVNIIGGWIQQKTEASGAATEKLRVEIARGQATTGSGGNSPTPIPVNADDAAAGFSAETFNTTQASAGTRVILGAKYLSFAQGVEFYLPDKMQYRADQGDGLLVIELTEPPTASITIGGSVWVEEI